MNATPSRPLQLSEKQRAMVRALLARHLPGTEVWAYGSRANGTAKPWSDLDLVVFASPAQQNAVAELREAFAESDLPFRVDLFVWDEIPETFRENIRKTHRVLTKGGLEHEQR